MSGVIPTFVQQKYALGIPYHAFNPAVKDDLKNQMCLICWMYFGTIKVMPMHCRLFKHVDDNAESNETLDVEENVTERVRPLQIGTI